MASLDDIYDLVDKLDKSKTEYLLVSIQKGKKNGKADVFYNLEDNNSLKILAKGLELLNQKIEQDKRDGNFDK
jgi:hypothetical protein